MSTDKQAPASPLHELLYKEYPTFPTWVVDRVVEAYNKDPRKFEFYMKEELRKERRKNKKALKKSPEEIAKEVEIENQQKIKSSQIEIVEGHVDIIQGKPIIEVDKVNDKPVDLDKVEQPISHISGNLEPPSKLTMDFAG
jgi:hypothetical protein